MASRYCTNRKMLASAGPSVEKFLGQGLVELGRKLGPIVWQFAATKKFDADDFEAFLQLLPNKHDGIALRHALEVRHESFATPAFIKLARKHKMAIVYATGKDVPTIDATTASFMYARIMTSRDELAEGFETKEFAKFTKQALGWAAKGDTFFYFISGAKMRDPAAAQALLRKFD